MTTETRTQLPDRWTVEDIRYLLEKLDAGRPILVAGHELGLPTIHDQDFRNAVHLGYGFFKVTGPGYTLSFDAGGAMDRTPSGQSWSPLRIEGEYAYDFDGVRATLQGYLNNGAGAGEEVEAEVEAEAEVESDPPARTPTRLHQESKAPLTGDKLLTAGNLPRDKKSLQRRLKQVRKDLEQKRGGMDVAFDVAINDGGASLRRLEANTVRIADSHRAT